MSDSDITFIRDRIRTKMSEKEINIDTAQVLFYMLSEIETLKEKSK